MLTTTVLRQAANKLYAYAFPIYRPLYAAYKTYADRAERELLRKILFQGAVAVDVGANIGIYSQFLSRCVGPGGMIHSFEPSPDNFRRLFAATRCFSNIRITHAVVGERTGECNLYISNKLNVDHRAYKADGDSRNVIPAEMVALDDYFKSGQRVDLIKVDIQGYELHALRGAQRVLHENSNINLLLEVWPAGLKQAGTSWQELVNMLESLSMNLTVVRPDCLAPFNTCHICDDSSWYVNILARRNRG